MFDDKVQRCCFFRVRPCTGVVTGKPEFDDLQGYMEAISAKCSAEVCVNGRRASLSARGGDTTTTLWFRDGTYGLLGYAYWHPFLKEFCDYYLATQNEMGLFNGCKQHDPDVGRSVFGRCTNEPDLECIAVLAVHRAWQATGDDVWMKRRLPQLERGVRAAITERKEITYTVSLRGKKRAMHHVLSWDPQHRLIKRTHSGLIPWVGGELAISVANTIP